MQSRRIVLLDDDLDAAAALRDSLSAESGKTFRLQRMPRSTSSIGELASSTERTDLVFVPWEPRGAFALQVIQRLTSQGHLPSSPVLITTETDSHLPALPDGIFPYPRADLNSSKVLLPFLDHCIESHRLTQRVVELEALIEKARKEARSARCARSTFLRSVSHELKTPLSAVIGLSESLMEQTQDSEQVEMLTLIRSSGQKLSEMLTQLLELARTERTTLQTDPVPFDPRALLEDVCASMGSLAASQGVTIHYNSQSDIQKVLADPRKLRQILVNLLSIAIQHTERGTIQVHLGDSRDSQKQSLVIKVSFGPPGVPRDALDRVIRRPQRLDPARIGIELGLASSRCLARVMGGDLTLAPRTGWGNCFVLEIEAPRCGPIATTSPDMTDDHPQRETTTTPDWKGRRILVVDDTRANQFVMKNLLKPTGAVVECVDNGQLALQHIAASESDPAPFDVVLMDLHMPVMGGIEAIRQLRKMGFPKPIIAMSAAAAPDDPDKCLQAGSQAFLARPFDRDHFLAVVGKAISLQTNSQAQVREATADTSVSA
ncbi:ATP-binding response regulator [Planctomicrobium sp. SH661]|uniref:ATP-binding response regulator n=1 Tax=Planctomicrobium sp. SH661 TaxID=3448124 RepID=UPI003F5C0CF6